MRPIIKITPTALDKILEQTSAILLVIMWVLVIYTFTKSPAIIPVHFNAAGKADDYGDKSTLLLLPAIATGIYVLLTLLNKYPHQFNYPITITEENAEKQYTIAVRVLRIMKLAILITFTLLILFTYFTAVGITKGLGAWFLPLILGIIMLPAILGAGSMMRVKKSD